MARAKRKGYKETLLGKTVVPAESDSLTAADKTKLAARKANNTAYEDLLLLIDGEQASEGWPSILSEGRKQVIYPMEMPRLRGSGYLTSMSLRVHHPGLP